MKLMLSTCMTVKKNNIMSLIKKISTCLFILACLNSCMYFWDEELYIKPLIKDFNLSGVLITRPESVRLYHTKTPNEYGGTVVVESEVTSVGFNNNFIVAKQSLYNPEVKTIYYIIGIKEYDTNESYEVIKCNTRQEFDSKKEQLNISKSLKLIDIIHLR